MQLLSQLYLIPSKSGQEEAITSFVLDCLRDLPLRIEKDSIGNIYITKGDSPSYPCVAAHLDEIHHPVERKIVITEDVIRAVDTHNQPTGCGADDKNGVWVVIHLLQTVDQIKAVLFVQEEKMDSLPGCRGARACNMDFFADVRYILECDRKGAHDIVNVGKNVPLCDKTFIPASILQKYNYNMVDGGKTDVVELKMRGLQIPVCNISCGYHNPHTDHEFTCYSELQNCLEMMQEIVRSVAAN